ncbi:hypothetical protein EGW08_019600 [Elysia chlorotica]|uniref:Uncharacterized protein n=1 Tax=Elysia chlorotica TaxID=188477 RepID=A0A3S1AZV8_ELYCH|nr:hypothetical protein EGW08_019600 [Elysia chlorotica]
MQVVYGGEWTYKYDGYIHVAKVSGGVYTMCSNSPKRSYHEEDTVCQKQKQTCYKQYGLPDDYYEHNHTIFRCLPVLFRPDLYAVEYEELRPNFRPSYQCFRFYRRGAAVVQIALSDRLYDPKGICNCEYFGAWWPRDRTSASDAKIRGLSPGTSPELYLLYKTATAPCPFTGGFNFHDIVEFSRDHTQTPRCQSSYSGSEPAPLRLESDCVQSEGFKMSFSEDKCIPAGSHFGKTQGLLCMASWMQDGNGFAMLRKENERAFYCARINFTANNENGCYPRFVCMYYDNPALGLMRYRFSNILSWPTALHDSNICRSDNFVMPPVFGDPESKFEKRSRSSPRAFTIQYLDDYGDGYHGYRDRMNYLLKSDPESFQCVGAMTYIDTYKTVITQSSGNRQETLCWMIIEDKTIVVVNTSSCNMQTARGIMVQDPRYTVHRKWQLNLSAASPELGKLCRANLEEREKFWRARLAQQMEDLTESRRGASRGASGGAQRVGVFLVRGFSEGFEHHAVHVFLVLLVMHAVGS